MPTISTTRNDLHNSKNGAEPRTQLDFTTVTFRGFEWKRLTKKEKQHARCCAVASFHSLIWIAKEMNFADVSYREAAKRVVLGETTYDVEINKEIEEEIRKHKRKERRNEILLRRQSKG